MKSAYQTPITISDALARLHRHDYVLPAIQREFVWEPEQICRLFDSLLRGYPIGTFLFWNVSAPTAEQFQFYDVVRDYHELKSPHSPRITFPQSRDVVAILDGQQRLTSLNIGLCGSYAEKLPRKRTTNLDAYPSRRLHLDLCHVGDQEDDALYRLAFLTDEEAASAGPDTHWFPVPDVLGMEDAGPAIFSYVQQVGLAEHRTAFHSLAKLRQVVHDDGLISYYLEDSQDLDKVLDIFIRVNSGGTVLSKSDLLLSVATAQFRALDAREEVHGLVDDLNATGHGFNFSKDLVLKSGLVLSNVSDVGFKVQNFTADNIARLEQVWPEIDRALRLGTKLLASFGFSGVSLKANSVLIPVAHYLHDRRHDDGYLTHAAWRSDREALRRWVIRSLVKPGVWGSGLDGLVRALRQAINDTDGPFPVAELEAVMARQGKSLEIDDAVLDDLVEMPYRDKRVFAVLSLLYPGVDTRNEFHIDHVFPKSLFTPKRLETTGIPSSDIEPFRRRFDLLPNLQLLEGPVNEAKRNRLPDDWARAHLPDPVARDGWKAAHDLHDLPVDLDDFLDFYDARQLRMRDKLSELLTSNAPQRGAEPNSAARCADSHHSDLQDAGTRSQFAQQVIDLIRRGAVDPGSTLRYAYKGTTYEVTIEPDGRLASDGRSFATPSQAARELTGQSAVNGWRVWLAPDGRPIGELRA